MKLIIDIPELDYECAKQRWTRGNSARQMDYYISNGIPLDDVKAEILRGHIKADLMYVGRIIEILDNIGKED